MTPKLEALRVFLVVSETGSLAAAAERLGRTPAALSMTLKQMEAELDGALFDSDRKSRLTPLGAVAQRAARRAVEAHDAAVGDIRRFARGEEGVVRVATTPSIARRVLPAAVARLAAQRPGLRFDLRDVDSHTVAELTAAGGVDFGVASRTPSAKGLRARFLREEPFCVVCRRDHALARPGRAVAWTDLSVETFIANGLSDMIAAPEAARLAAEARLRLRNVSTIYAFVRAGLGVSLLPRMATPAEGDLVGAPLSDGAAAVQIYAFSRADEALPPAAEALLDLVAETMASGERWRP